MKNPTINPDAKALEDAFFVQENAKLLQRLREQAAAEARREALREALKIDDPELLDTLVEMELGPETAVALQLVPLVEVAWADGSVQRSEREAILKAAEQQGVAVGTVGHDLLENWLAVKPGRELMDVWQRFAGALAATLPAGARQTLRDGLLSQARSVAEAAGGFLGIGDKVSKEEQAVLGELERALS